MIKNDEPLSVIWEMAPRELAVATIVLAVWCALALVGHGRSGSSPADVRVLKLDRPSVAVALGSGHSGRLDINRASEAELELLPGLGRHRAKQIVIERQKRGAFRTVWELSEAPGMTQALVARLEPLLQAQAPQPVRASPRN